MNLFCRLTRVEMVKIFSKPRTYIGFATIFLLVPVIMWLVRKYGLDIYENALGSLEDSFVFVGSLTNGLFAAYFLMNVLWVHFPFLIILVSGDVMASESASGAFRILLTRSANRLQVITAKFVATFFYTFSIVFFMGLCCIGFGMLMVGGGDLLVFDKGILILSQNEALLRFLLAYTLAVWAQMTIAALSFLFSTLSSNSVGPIIGTYAVIVVSFILSVLRIDALRYIRPYLFTSYFDVFFAPFAAPIPWSEIASDMLRLGAFIIIFYLISVFVFLRRDITT